MAQYEKQVERNDSKLVLRILLPIAVLLIGAGAGWWLKEGKKDVKVEPSETPRPTVRVRSVSPRSLRVNVHTQGTVHPRMQSDVSAEVSGRIIEVSDAFVRGGFFEEGDLLLKIDSRDYQLALAQSRLEVQSAMRRLEEERADARVARAEWDELGQGEPSPLTLRIPQLEEVEAALAAAQAALERAERDLERTSVFAPYSGRMLVRRALRPERGGRRCDGQRARPRPRRAAAHLRGPRPPRR